MQSQKVSHPISMLKLQKNPTTTHSALKAGSNYKAQASTPFIWEVMMVQKSGSMASSSLITMEFIRTP